MACESKTKRSIGKKNEEKEKGVERLWTVIMLLEFKILGVGFWVLKRSGSTSVELRPLEIVTDLTHRASNLRTC